MAGKRLYKGLGRAMYLVALTRCINRFGDFVEIVLVLILSVKLSLEARTVGYLTTAVYVLRFFGQMSSGWLSDKIPRKRILPVLQLSVAATYLCCCYFIANDNIRAIVICILLSSPFRGGTQPVTNAMTADVVQDDKRMGDAFSLLYLLTNVGIALGSIIAGLLFNNLGLLFSLSAVLISISALIVIFLVPYVPVHKKEGKEKRDKKNIIRPVFFFLLFFSSIYLLYSFFYNGTTFILPMEAGSLFGEETGPIVYSSIQSVNAVTVILFTPLLTYLFSRFSSINRMVMSMIFFFGGAILFSVSRTSWFFLFSMIVWTLGEILMATNTSVFLNEVAPKENRGFYNSLFLSLGSFGASLAPTVLGYFLDFYGYKTVWVSLSVFVILIALLLSSLKPLRKKLGPCQTIAERK